MIIDSGSDHQFVCAGLLDELFQSGADGLGRADEGARKHVGDMGFFHGRPVGLNVINRRRKLAARAAHGIGKALLGGGKKSPRFSIGIGGNYVYTNHGVCLLELGRWPKFPAVHLERQHERVRREVGSKRIRQTELGGKLRAKETGAEYPDWDIETGAGNCLHRLARLQRTEKRLKLAHVIRETIGAAGITAKRTQRALVSAGSAAKAKIDAPGIERFERAKLLSDYDRRMIGQHDSAGANTDGAGASGNISDDDRRCGAGDANHVVVLGQPEAAIAPTFGVLGQIEGVMQGIGRRGSLRHERQIKNRERDQYVSLYLISSILMKAGILQVQVGTKGEGDSVPIPGQSLFFGVMTGGSNTVSQMV